MEDKSPSVPPSAFKFSGSVFSGCGSLYGTVPLLVRAREDRHTIYAVSPNPRTTVTFRAVLVERGEGEGEGEDDGGRGTCRRCGFEPERLVTSLLPGTSEP